MQNKYYVSHESNQMGPYTIDEIVKFVSQGTLSPLDYIYDEGKSDWILFLDHEYLADLVKALKPKAPPKPEENVVKSEKVKKPSYDLGKDASAGPTSAQHEWFVLKGENKFGPFSYTDVVKMLQQGVVFEFDFAWHSGMSSWMRLAEIKEFDKDNIRALKNSTMPEISEVFFRRRYKRVKYGCTILIHDNKKLWKGQGVEISEGGVGVTIENSMLLPGQILYLHFKPGDGVPPFNAVCEVVSKHFTSEVSGPDAPIRYGLKFNELNPDTQKLLKDYTKTAA